MSEEETPQQTTQPLSSKEPGFESRVFGVWGVIIRYLMGAISVFTMCLIAYMDAITTRISVQTGTGWPGEWHFLIMTIGVTICAINFSNANKTLQTILGSGNLREKAKAMVMRKFNITPSSDDIPVQDYYWWNPESKAAITLQDETDLSPSGFIRVPSARPTPLSTWNVVTQTWEVVKEVK